MAVMIQIDYEVIIGLEVHAQLLTRSKMFCGCSTTFGGPPNSQTCPVCQGMPGVLPVINKRAVEFAVRTALALNCRIAESNRFARKHYFYPDMPKNFQISQYEEPLAVHGWLEIEVEGQARRIGIERVHMEEDVGKLLHAGTLDRAQSSLVDYNRSGVPLLEIVSKPDIRSPEEAGEYLRRLRTILRYLGVCDGNMEEGSMRCDANISIRPRGSTAYGTKVEIKNVNSFRNVQRALEYEASRQAQALDRGERLVQEARLWDADRGVTLSMRSKEFAHDYRYFPEPDLVPLQIPGEWVEEIRASLPELPVARRHRFMEVYGLPAQDADLLTTGRELADYFEEVARRAGRPKIAANWIMSELLRELKGDERMIVASPVSAEHLARLILLIEDGTISGKIAKDLFERMARSGEDPADIVKREGLTQVADAEALAAVVDKVIAENPSAVADYRAGKGRSLGFLVGAVMKATQGKANPQIVNQLLLARLEAGR
jgi:aspartyl-tRNA(Asn)/glutamyl-tRNA(Gln) amidotransferase subunit B